MFFRIHAVRMARRRHDDKSQDNFQQCDTVGLLVHKYLKANDYDDCTKTVILHLENDSKLQGLSLQSVFQNYLKASSERDPVETAVRSDIVLLPTDHEKRYQLSINHHLLI